MKSKNPAVPHFKASQVEWIHRRIWKSDCQNWKKKHPENVDVDNQTWWDNLQVRGASPNFQGFPPPPNFSGAGAVSRLVSRCPISNHPSSDRIGLLSCPFCQPPSLLGTIAWLSSNILGKCSHGIYTHFKKTLRMNKKNPKIKCLNHQNLYTWFVCRQLGTSSWNMKFHNAKWAEIPLESKTDLRFWAGKPKKMRLCAFVAPPYPPPVSNQKREQINRFVCAKPTSFTNVKTPSSPSNLTKCTASWATVFCGTAWPEKKNKTNVFQFNHPAVQQLSLLGFEIWALQLGSNGSSEFPGALWNYIGTQMNTHSIKRCIWGWWIRVPSQKYHHFPSENWQWTCKKIPLGGLGTRLRTN